MAYSDFTLANLDEQFGIKNRRKRLFKTVEPIEPSDRLKVELLEIEDLPIRSEKAKSEWMVVPILKELRNRNEKFFTIYSGENLVADEESGLKGECDFILAKDIGSFDINLPIFQIVEAKKNDIDLGIPQCAAQMIGAKLFNQKKKSPIDVIFGCVTNGDNWIFLKLEDDLQIDTHKYYLNNVEELLGVFQFIIDFYKRMVG